MRLVDIPVVRFLKLSGDLGDSGVYLLRFGRYPEQQENTRDQHEAVET